MEQKAENKRKILKTVIVIVVIVGVIWTAQVLVHNFDVMQLLKAIHGG